MAMRAFAQRGDILAPRRFGRLSPDPGRPCFLLPRIHEVLSRLFFLPPIKALSFPLGLPEEGCLFPAVMLAFAEMQPGATR